MTFDETGKRPDLASYQVTLPTIDEKLEKSPITVDPKLPQKPLKAIRAIVAGNGVDPQSVTLGEHDLKTMPFAGTTNIKVTAQLAKKRLPGRDTKGDVVQDEQGLFGAVEKHIRHVVATPLLRQKILDIIMKRPDKGFAIDNKKLGFKTLSKQFVMYEPCLTCHKTGQVVCLQCEGRKQVKCTTCRGQREVMCQTCRGDGVISDQNGSRPCTACARTGRVPCTFCGGDGLIKCKTCYATGKVKCDRCIGSGWNTLLLIAELEALYHFTFEEKDLPLGAIQIMANLGVKLMERSVAEIEVTGTITPDVEPVMPYDEIVILYKGRMPFGPIRFNIGGQSVGALLYGYHGDLADCPDFMERIGKDHIERLLIAAEQPKEASEMLPHAVKARFVREAIQAALMRGRAKAIQMYKARYPYGFSDTMIRDLITLADTATKNASRDFRIYGLIASQALVTLLQAAYYLGPGLTLVAPHLPGPGPQMMLDVGLTIMFMALAYQMPRLAGGYALKQRLGSALKATKATQLMPRAGRLEWAAVAAVPAVTVALIYSAKIIGGVTPAWLHWFGI